LYIEQNDEELQETDVSRWEWTRRVFWIGLRLILVYVFADEFQPFFYQAF